MRRLLLIANPAASGFTGALHREITAILTGPYEVEAVWPTSPEEVRRLAAEAAADGFHLVVALGGDGVAHHAANGLVGTVTGLGLIPAGSTNVLAKILGLPRRPKAAARFLAAHPSLRTVPTAHLLTDSLHGTRSDHALFASGLGFDAEVVEQAERQPFRKLRFGAVHYARSASWVLWSRFRKRPANLRVETEGLQADAVGVLVQVRHPYTFFGRLPLSVSRHSTDGLSVLIIERLGVLRAPAMLYRAARGPSLEGISGLQVWTGCHKLVVEAEPASWVQSDGELLGRAGRVEVTHVSDRLLVTAPARPSP